ncbi:unnamed protein product [Durusdinium trenchii]|uniref:Uncharacterized protein n=1 Tax=Durusdinium trenchii TaxID=1381693 RepID=A0ABP0QDL1_9DINO
MTDEAIACREDSSASNHQSNLAEERDASPALSSRWAERLLSLTREYNVQRPAAPINVVSGCTGISAESFVFEALNLNYNILSASDPDLKCHKFLLANLAHGKPTHWFKNLEDQMKNRPCCDHRYAQQCQASPVQPDLGICGTPCHPYSTQRANRFAAGSVDEHKEFNVAMEQFLKWFERFEPKALVFEQVMGFQMPFIAGGSETPLSRFKSLLQRCDFNCGGYYLVTKQLDMKIWYQISRPRLFLVFLRKDAYSKDDAKRFSELCEDVFMLAFKGHKFIGNMVVGLVTSL